jgi:hypothetical protein
MEKIIAHLWLLSRGLIDGVTALYRPWSVVGFLEMADAPEKVVSARSGWCDRRTEDRGRHSNSTAAPRWRRRHRL